MTAPAPFRCVACRNVIVPSPWPYDAHQRPPLCAYCTQHWGKGFGFNVCGVTRGDRRAMMKLASLVQLIDWEVKNGRFRAI